MSGRIRVGLSSWTDKSLIESGEFYPPHVRDAASRLSYYTQHFPDLVEVNSTYYGLPSERTALLWHQRTPADFIFDIKIFSLFTFHPTPPASLPKDLCQELGPELLEKEMLYFDQVPREIAEETLQRFTHALTPLQAAGKVGAILLQFPPWFHPKPQSYDHIVWLTERLQPFQVAVEFRQRAWLDESHRAGALQFLSAHGLAYVCVDEPAGLRSSVPPLAFATNPRLSYVRFHGRRAETWEQSGISVHERTKYLYKPEEFQEWVPKIRRLAEQSQEVHVLMNTNYRDYAVRNAKQLMLMVEQYSE
ncbi:MAG: DUF72 domain-containing protein [Anaerolineae bacterium]